MRLSIPPNTNPPTLLDVQEAISRLRVEVDLVEEDEQGAALQLELGVLHELGRDDHSAAKDLLGAINLGSALREPLERLIALIERRRSFKNLGKLLDRLGRIAGTQEEIFRAQLARGDFFTDHQEDLGQALVAYEGAVAAEPNNGLGWLALQFLAGKSEDASLAARALSQRVELSQDAEFQALLRLELARAQARIGDHAAAQRSLEVTSQEPTPQRFVALTELERLARSQADESLASSALQRQAQLIEQALSGPARGSELGVPDRLCTASAAADAWLRAGLSLRGLSDAAQTAPLFARAHAHLPGSLPVGYAHMLALEDAFDLAGALGIARQLLSAPEVGPRTRASLFLRVANAALTAGDVHAALGALEEALRADPECIPARALQLNLLQQTDRSEELASAIEGLAQVLPTGPAQVRQFLLAAAVWSHSAKNSDAARAALSQASAAGASALTCARVGRTLASLAANPAWELEAMSRLLKVGGAEETAATQLQLARRAWLSRDELSTQEKFQALGADEPGRFLASLFAAYAGIGDGVAALLELAQRSADPARAAALRQLVAYRKLCAKEFDAATELLTELQALLPADPIVAQQLAHAQLAKSEPKLAARALAVAAEAHGHRDVSEALLVHASLLSWRSDDRDAAVKFLERAQQLSAGGSSELLSWALRAARADMPEARRKALMSAQAAEGASDLGALERFSLEVGLQSHKADATQALDRADEVGLGDVGDAVQLARALWPDAEGHEDALSSLDGRSPAGVRVSRAVAFMRARAELNPDKEVLADLAAAWAETGSLPAGLEWLAAAQAAGRVEDEIRAREAVARHLTGEAEAALLAGGALVGALAGQASRPALASALPQARLTNAELATPGCSPARRSHALMELGDLAGEEVQAQNSLLVGYNLLALGDAERALRSFRTAAEHYPGDLSVHEGLRDAASGLGDSRTEADACYRLGQLTCDPERGAHFFRRAAALFLDSLSEPERGYQALTEAVRLDIADADSFLRLFRRVRDQKDHQAVLDLSARRLAATQDANEITKLYWERARAHRALKNTAEALTELESVRMLEPEHVGAMALAGEIYLTGGQLERAAKELAALAAHPEAPSDQRLMSGIAAVDLYETKLGDLGRALEVLEVLKRAQLATLPVRERLARAAAKAERWDAAARLLEELMVERDTRAGRIEAARLALAIRRDRLRTPGDALAASERLLRESPTDAEAIDLLLDDVFEEARTRELLEAARDALVGQFRAETSAADALEPEQVARLARIAESLEDLSLRQATLGVLISLGISTEEMGQELRALDHRAHAHPQVSISKEMLTTLLHPGDSGPLAELVAHLAPALSEILGPTLKSLEVGRKHRVKAQSASPVWSELAHWAGALGVRDFELYVGGTEPSAMHAVRDGDLIQFVIGESIRAPFGPEIRQRLAKTVFSAARGTQLLLLREPADVAALCVAACRVGDVRLPGPEYALVGEFERLLTKELPRRIKKDLPALARAVASSEQDPRAWALAALASLQRLGALAVGDASWVLFSAAQRGTSERDTDTQTEQIRRSVLEFALSPEFQGLRKQLGLSVE
ncbi:MAG: hypothetical protein RJA70_2032 [Pseudomonadota bacterium]|jgi:tetratricopeptide (TPR) repeat protein